MPRKIIFGDYDRCTHCTQIFFHSILGAQKYGEINSQILGEFSVYYIIFWIFLYWFQRWSNDYIYLRLNLLLKYYLNSLVEIYDNF